MALPLKRPSFHSVQGVRLRNRHPEDDLVSSNAPNCSLLLLGHEAPETQLETVFSFPPLYEVLTPYPLLEVYPFTPLAERSTKQDANPSDVRVPYGGKHRCVLQQLQPVSCHISPISHFLGEKVMT